MPVIQAHRQIVWILEPESEFRTLLVELSVLHGHSTHYANDLSQAWQLLELTDTPPDLVITAWTWGEQTCQKWIEALLQRAPQTQVVCFASPAPPHAPRSPHIRFLHQPEQLSELLQILNPTRKSL